MICPVCHHVAAPKASAENGTHSIAICAACGLSCKVDALGVCTPAKIADLSVLTDDQLTMLRKARAPIVRRAVSS